MGDQTNDTNEYLDSLDNQGLPLAFTGDKGSTVATVLRPLAYETKALGRVVVPSGFASDGCSIPRSLWRLVGHPFTYAYLREAILHDWLYRTQPCGRLVADQVFESELKKGGVVPYVRRKAIYLALRAFGWVAWDSNARRLKERQ